MVENDIILVAAPDGILAVRLSILDFLVCPRGFVSQAKTDKPDDMWISTAFAGKYHLNTGDSFTMHEKYENKQYTWHVAGVYSYDAALAVFMPTERKNSPAG